MKKMLMMVAAFAVGILMTATMVRAENAVDLGVGVSAISESGFDSGTKITAGFMHYTGNTGVGVSIGRADYENGEWGDKIKTLPISLNARFNMPMNAVKPYVTAGLDYYLNDIESPGIDEEVMVMNEFCSDFNYYYSYDCSFSANVELKNAFGAHIGAGFAIPIGENVEIGLVGVYRFAKADANMDITCEGMDCVGLERLSESMEVDLGGLDLSAQVTLRF